jgi:hypothetical protein
MDRGEAGVHRDLCLKEEARLTLRPFMGVETVYRFGPRRLRRTFRPEWKPDALDPLGTDRTIIEFAR